VGINRIVLQTLTFTWTYRLTTIGYFLLSSDVVNFCGHAFVADNKVYTAYHVVSTLEKIYLKTNKHTSLFPVELGERIGADIVELTRPGIAAMLGLRSLKFSFVNDGTPVQVYSYVQAQDKYLMQSCTTQYDAELPMLIYTFSNTSSGDSGLPVLQSGKVVAVHLGGNTSKAQNVHEIPVDIVRKDIMAVAQRKTYVVHAVDLGIIKESVVTGHHTDRARDILEYQQMRSRGEDVDDQGFRNKRTSTKDDYPSETEYGKANAIVRPGVATVYKRGVSWADVQESGVVPVPIAKNLRSAGAEAHKQVSTPTATSSAPKRIVLRESSDTPCVEAEQSPVSQPESTKPSNVSSTPQASPTCAIASTPPTMDASPSSEPCMTHLAALMSSTTDLRTISAVRLLLAAKEQELKKHLPQKQSKPTKQQ